MRPLEFCLKFNQNITNLLITSVLESAYELYMHGLSNNTFEWHNDRDNACTFFEFDVFENDNGPVMPFEEATNIVITLKYQPLVDELQFAVIDIFSNRIDLCEETLSDAIFSIPLSSSTDIDEGYVFQLETESTVMPFTVEHLKILQKIGKHLVNED